MGAALTRGLDYRDPYTGEHAHRVTAYTLMLAHELQLSRTERTLLQAGALLHDIGKIGVPEAVLNKPGELTPDELAQIRAHPTLGCALLQSIRPLAPILPIVRSHHERWDGLGYPDGLAGEDIPRLARIVAVADAFDAMTSDRPYRSGRSVPEALAQIAAAAGTQFDPEIVEAFLSLRSRFAVSVCCPQASAGRSA
jgi:putative nucleotidyltransferase with HDIG domain